MTKATGKPQTALQGQTPLKALDLALTRAKPAFDSLGRKYINPERFARIILAAARRPPKKEGQKTILDCTPTSVILACMEAAALGLEPETPQQLCYLIPYGNICTLQMGYPGLVALALRDKTIKRIETRLHYENDEFDAQYAPIVTLTHKPCLNQKKRGEAVGVYAIAHFTDGDIDFEYMTIEEVEEIRDRSAKSPDSSSSPWTTAEGEMRRKTVLKRACKRWGKSKELDTALAIDNHEGKDPRERIIDVDVADCFSEYEKTQPTRTVSAPPPAQPPAEGKQPAEPAKDAPSAGKPRCDGNHGEPQCADPQCWLSGDPEPPRR